MPTDFSQTLVIGISATALFDLREADRIFQEHQSSDPTTAIRLYRDYMLQRENEPLAPGTGMPLVVALLDLNRHTPAGEPACLFRRKWTAIPAQTGHLIRRKLDGYSR